MERSPKIVQHAVSQQLSQELRDGTYRWIVEADIKSFFDEMDHDWLCEMLAQRIDDRALLGLIRKWLQAGVLEPGANQIEEPEAGTPLGRKAERTGRSTMAIGSYLSRDGFRSTGLKAKSQTLVADVVNLVAPSFPLIALESPTGNAPCRETVNQTMKGRSCKNGEVPKSSEIDQPDCAFA